MLDRIYGEDDVGDSSGLMKSMELRFKLKIDSGSEGAALNALRYSRPRIFHKGRPTIVSVAKKSRLNAIPSYEAWNGGGEGVMDFVIEKMNLLQDAVASDIEQTLEVGSKGHWIATKCLAASVTFLTQLFGCVDTIYKRLFNFSKFTTEQAWSLTTQVLDRILADLFVPKDNILQSITNRSPEKTCAHVLLSAFKTHDIMATYVSYKFENHPSVSTEYVKFLATNSGSEKVEEAKKKADVASSKCTDLATALAALTKRVKALDGK